MRATTTWCGIAAVAGALLTGCGGGDEEEAAPAPQAAPAVDRMVRHELLGGPDWLATDGSYVYVRRDTGAVDRLDPATGEVLASVAIPGGLCQGLGAGGGTVWTCVADGGVARVDTDAEQLGPTVVTGKAAEQGTLAVGYGRVWVLTGDGSELIGVDTATGAESAPVEVGVRGTDVHADAAGLWVVSRVDDALVRVDPETGTVLWRVDAPGGATMASTGDGDVWVGAARSTTRFGPDGTAEQAVEVGPGAEGAIAVDGDELWVRSPERFLERIDLSTGAVVERHEADVTSGGDVLVAFDAVWATAFDDAALFRIDV